MNKRKKLSHTLIAALLISSAAICTAAQNNNRAVKQNTREPEVSAPATATTRDATSDVHYSYEFRQPEFNTRRILIEHDAEGRGKISFERKGSGEAIIEPLELSATASARIKSLWEALRFLDSDTSYQADKQFPHLGTVRLRMKSGARERATEFNWTSEPNARLLASEYWHAADQAIFVFDITLARENLPLEAPKLMDRLDQLLRNNGLSDPKQLIPLLRELSTDERIPLMARNHAGRILKKIEK
jgi:hypothetical protein